MYKISNDMKKLITLFGVWALFVGTLSAQDCHFKVAFDVTPATCLNNGKVHYALLNEDDNPILLPASLGLDSVRIYYKVNEGDSAHYGRFYAGGWDSLVIGSGNFIVGVEGICNCGLGCYIKVDTHLVVNLPTTYTPPVVESFSNIAHADVGSNSLGIRPTINCMNTGRVQLKILDGKFPFTVDIIDQTTGDTLRTDTLTTRQYGGTNTAFYDYRDYYSFDSLPAGVWEFHVEDGCGYKMPIHTQEVFEVDLPTFTGPWSSVSIINEGTIINRRLQVGISINNSNKDYSSGKYKYNYNYLPQFAEYRFKYGDDMYTDWKALPAPTSYTFYVNDTIPNTMYCEIMKKNFTLEYRDNCLDTIYRLPYKISFKKSNTNYAYGHDTCSTNRNHNYNTIYACVLYNNTQSSVGFSLTYHDSYQPADTLVWVYTDPTSGSVIKSDTIRPSLNITTRINTLTATSHLHDTTLRRLYNYNDTEAFSISVQRQLFSSVCGEIFNTTDQLNYNLVRKDTAKWSTAIHQAGTFCCSSRSIAISSTDFNIMSGSDSIIIRMIHSPDNNRYNFEAVYDTIVGFRWIRNERLDNTATLSYPTNSQTKRKAFGAFYLADNCMPSGPYQWQIVTPCGSYTVPPDKPANIQFRDTYEPYFVEEPSYTIDEECTRATLTYTAGKIGFHRYNTSPFTGNDTLVSDYIPPTTYFRIISGPPGGYDQSGRYYKVNEPMELSMKGRYIVRYYQSLQTASFITNPGGQDYFCGKYIQDTIDYEPTNTVKFSHAVALRCDPNSTYGTVYVGGSNGSEPYTYTLYSNADKNGAVLGTNTSGIFENIEMSAEDVFSCSVQDSCGASFYVNLQPMTWSELQKVWFDGGLTVTSTCEGSMICVNALTLGNILHYNWTGPDGFSDTSARSCVFIPRGSHEGWYKVHIVNSGCGDDFYDSVYLDIDRAPSVSLIHDGITDTTVCPGSPAELKIVPFSPNTTGNISFTLVFESEAGTTTTTFSRPSGDTIRHTINPVKYTKVYTSSINDGVCNYTLADDTFHVYVHTINPYTITTVFDTICHETSANLHAFSSLTPPYAIRWYNDYELTYLVKEDTIVTDSSFSSLATPDLTEDRILYIAVENNDFCPTKYGNPIHTLNMKNGTTELSLGNTYRFYDSGGPNANYSTNERLLHTFKSSDGKPVTLKFISYSFNANAHLYVFSGPDPNTDSLLYDITYGVSNPGTIVSRGDALTCYFVSAGSRSSGWNAIVEHEPAKAIAFVRPKNEISLFDTVCQSHHRPYADPYHISPDVVSIDSLNKVVQISGTHYFTNLLEGAGLYGCDSTVHFYLTVNRPPRYDTTVVITNLHHNGYSWHDSIYTQHGRHFYYNELEKGCDSVDVLHLVVIDIDTTADTTCLNTPVDLMLPVTIDNKTIYRSMPLVGDVLCSDSTTMHPDSFLLSGKTAMGVVVYTDLAEGYGAAIALHDLISGIIAREIAFSDSLFPNTYNNGFEAAMDWDGFTNTELTLSTSPDAPGFRVCYYYDHTSFSMGSVPQGWYLPALGELKMAYNSRFELNRTLNKLKAHDSRITPLGNVIYKSSTFYTNFTGVFVFNFNYGYHEGRSLNTSDGYYRSFIKFPLP